MYDNTAQVILESVLPEYRRMVMSNGNTTHITHQEALAAIRAALETCCPRPKTDVASMRLHLGDDALWVQLECNGKHTSINLDSIRPARWFAEAYRKEKLNV